MSKLDVAIVGATGVVGETILRVLEERRVPVGAMAAFASRARPGAARFRGETLDVRATDEDALRGFEVVFFASGEDSSERYTPALLERGSYVIDNSSTFRMQAGVPLVIPEVNPEAMLPEHHLFPVANCTAIVLCTALRPIRDVAGLRSVRVATYQAASGAGRAGLDEFLSDERAVVLGEEEPAAQIFPQHLAHNVIPQIGAFDASGYSGEERKVAEETRKMLSLPELFVSATTVRVPVRTAHSEVVFVETERETTLEELMAAFEGSPGLVFHHDGIVTPREVEGTDTIHVARLRAEPPVRPSTLSPVDSRSGPSTTELRSYTQDDSGAVRTRNFTFWCVGDQLRKGAATNAVQILELLLSKGFVGA
jgi:aspartate-semialdehyde dehydrogenase